MGQRRRERRIPADIRTGGAAGRTAGRAAGRRAVRFLGLLEHGAGRRVDVVVVFDVAGVEFDLIDGASILAVALHAHARHIRFLQPRVGQRRRERRIPADVRAGRRSALRRVVPDLARELDDLAAHGVHVVFVLEVAGIELDLIDHAPVLHVHLDGQPLRIRLRNARVGQRRGGGRFRTDVAAVAGGAGAGDIVRLRFSQQQAQRIDRQAGKILGAQRRVLGKQLLDQRRLAARDVVGGRQRIDAVVGRERLREDRALDAEPGQQRVDLSREPLLQRCRALLVVPLHGDEDGVGQLVDVAVLEQRADQRVDGDVELHAGEVHAVEQARRILIASHNADDALVLIDGELNARVHVEHDDCRALRGGVGTNDAQHADGQHRTGGDGGHGGDKRMRPAAALRLLRRGGQACRTLAQLLGIDRRRMIDGRADLFFNLFLVAFLFHGVMPPLMPV